MGEEDTACANTLEGQSGTGVVGMQFLGKARAEEMSLPCREEVACFSISAGLLQDMGCLGTVTAQRVARVLPPELRQDHPLCREAEVRFPPWLCPQLPR